MRLLNLNVNEFEAFATSQPLRNYCQTSKYAETMTSKDYTYDYIGYADDSNNLVAASLILKKKLSSGSFVYAPKGILIDYYNIGLVKMFINDLAKKYKKQGYAFFKINPEIIIGEIKPEKNFLPLYNQNATIIDDLKELGFKRRREIKPLDFTFPRINPYINLKSFDYKKLDNEFIKIIESVKTNGLSIEKLDNSKITEFYEIIKSNSKESIDYYQNLLKWFKDDAECLIIKIDYEKCLVNAKERYEKEQENNNYWNELIQNDNNETSLNMKMESDRSLLKYKDEIVSATEGLRKHKYKNIGAAIIIKYQNRVSIVASNFTDYDLYGDYYLYNYLIETYGNSHEFLDLNGLASNFEVGSIYAKYNEAKLAFKPTIYEFIGEFDLILRDSDFKRIQSKGILSKEFGQDFEAK